MQSHTKSHPHLSEVDEARLREELLASKEALDHRLGQDTDELALPGGDKPRPALREVVRECGYRVVATSRWGRNDDVGSDGDQPLLWLRRCTAPRSPDARFARRIVQGDTRLALVRSSREAALNALRSTLGPSRYARWRRLVLDALTGGAS